MKFFQLLLCLLFAVPVFAQADSSAHSITIHFLYGSKPAKGYKGTETKYFGGIHGGHVFMQFDGIIFSFMPNNYPVHVFAHRNKKQSGYFQQSLSEFSKDTAGSKVTSITFPLNDSQYTCLLRVRDEYKKSTPYDYAFFGMRCAAACYNVLGCAGVVKQRGNFANVCINFYPKPMRKRMLNYAKQHHLAVVYREGRASRKWERD